MPSEKMGTYEVEYSAVPAADGKAWVAHVAIYGHSPNPMHRNCVFPDQRVSPEMVFSSSAEAEAEARKAAVAMLESGRHSGI
jgi:hypothetical protein